MLHTLRLSDLQALALSDDESLDLILTDPLIGNLGGQGSDTPLNLTAVGGAVVLSATLVGGPYLLQATADLEGLTGSSGTFTLWVRVNGQVVQPSPLSIAVGAETNARLRSGLFLAPENATVEIRVHSPNADISVDGFGGLHFINLDSPGSFLTLMGCSSNAGSVGGGPVGPSVTNAYTTAGSGTGSGIGAGDSPGGLCPQFWGYDMALEQLDTETGTGDIAGAYLLVLTHTPNVDEATAVLAQLALGNTGGAGGDLGGVGGNYTFRVSIAGRVLQPSPVTVVFEASTPEAVVTIGPVVVPAGQEFKLYAKSPNAAETSVLWTSRLFEVDTAALTAALIADAVWDEAKSGHTTPDTFGDYLDDEITSRASPANVATELATYDGPTNTETAAYFTTIKGAGWDSGTDTLEEIRDAIDNIGSAAGSGAIQYTYEVLDDNDQPLPNCEVWVNTHLSNSELNILASGTTDGDGEVTFFLDAGVYSFWRQRDGFNLQVSNPHRVTVS